MLATTAMDATHATPTSSVATARSTRVRFEAATATRAS